MKPDNLRYYFTRAMLVLILQLYVGLYALAQNPNEYEVKAVYIYNFVNFVEWPSSSFAGATDPFVIGVAGKNVFGNTLSEVVQGEKYNGRPIEVRMINNTDEAGECQIVFLEESCIFFNEIISATQGRPVLTIADRKDFMEMGGVIRFFLEEQKVKLEVSQTAAELHGLTISAKLLRLARIHK